MIKINLSHQILDKHRKYLCFQSKIKADLQEGLLKDFFTENYLDEILTLKTNNLYKNNRIKNLQNELERELSKIGINSCNLKALNYEHKRFVSFLLNNIKNLEHFGLSNCRSLNNKYKCTNIFLAKPKELNWIEKNIIYKYHRVISIILELEIYIDNKAEKKILNTYSNFILNKLDYKKFSGKDMNRLYKREYKFLLSISEYKFYEDYLKKYKIIEEKENSKGNPISVKTINAIRNKILVDIEDLKKDYTQHSEFYSILNELYGEIKKINLYQKAGGSIGKKLFIENIIDKVNIALNNIESKKIIKEETISLLNIKKYNKEYQDTWSAYQFLMELGLQTCPYCNRQYISPIYSSKGKLRADLDHFLPKYRYPYFSMSIFNLIPSCKFCNSSLKGISNFSYENNLNPYEYGFDEILKFTYKVKSYEATIGIDQIEIVLKDNVKTEEEKEICAKAKNNADIFQIENLYNYHKKEILDLIKKRIIYTEQYFEDLRKQYRGLFTSDIEIVEFVIGNYLEAHNLDKKPLSKLTQDICEELGFIRTEISEEKIDKLKELFN